MATSQKIVTDAKEISIVGGVERGVVGGTVKGVGRATKGVLTAPLKLLNENVDKAPRDEVPNKEGI